ncbi:hypothetical protein EIP86_000696 [Pleurotus ostreatoroseus]|nr:hypothetical protein EIP86_000696 [Pleurotus ostreatoroseus]
MAVIVPAPIGAKPAPVDVNFVNIKPAPAPLDPAIPRSALAHALVAAAAVAIPALAPALPSQDSEYRLASKRKSPDSDDDDEPENNVSPKRLRTDDDALFGALPPASQAQRPIATSQDVLTYTIEQALVAIFQQEPAQEVEVEPTPTPEPEPQPELELAPAPAPAVSSRLPSSPLSSPSFLPTYDATAPEISVPVRPVLPPTPTRAVEPPIWKVACRTRVETIVASYGAPAVRAALDQEISRWATGRRPSPSPSPLSRGSGLKLAIYTPSYFTSASSSSSPSHGDEPASPTTPERTESEMEEDVDMSFDIEDEDDARTVCGEEDHDDEDCDSEDDDDEEDSEDDDDETEDDGADAHAHADASSPHESLMDMDVCAPASSSLPIPSPSPSPSTDAPSSHPNAQTSPAAPSPLSPSFPAPFALPRLASIPVYCLRTYPELLGLGTPARAAPWACGRFVPRGKPGVGGLGMGLGMGMGIAMPVPVPVPVQGLQVQVR